MLEARDRVGGRVHSYTGGGFSGPIDLGASLITGTATDVAKGLRPDPSAVVARCAPRMPCYAARICSSRLLSMHTCAHLMFTHCRRMRHRCLSSARLRGCCGGGALSLEPSSQAARHLPAHP